MKNEYLNRRIHSFVWGGLAAVFFIVMGIIKASESTNTLIGCLVLAVLSFAFISCLILDNNFVFDMVSTVFSWGFVQMPGLIFTLDLDGIIWLLTVKLIFWIIGIILAILCGLLALALGLVISLFVYPFAIYKNVKARE